jgi:hypothetical protein
MIYALIKANVVVSVEALDATTATAMQAQYTVIDITNVTPPPQVGWVLAGGVLSGPPPVQSWIITRYAFRLRFSMDEMVGIYAAADNLPSGYPVKVLMDNLAEAMFVDLQNSNTQLGLGLLEEFGLVTPARASVILTTPPTEDELYIGVANG